MSGEDSARQLAAARRLATALAPRLNLDAHIELWDGSRVPLGPSATGPFTIRIASPGTVGALLRRPGLDGLIRAYALGRIDYHGGSIIDFGHTLDRGGRSVKLGPAAILGAIRDLRPLLFARDAESTADHGFGGESTGRARATQDNAAFVQFHYDLSNAFYRLFLDPEMVYSCAYFTDWDNDIATAQRDKLEMICRKLRLKPGDRFLDIGCGWGGLICHAATHHGVKAHGITLSKEQLTLAAERICERGLSDRVTVSFTDYANVTGTYDKIASIGMYEHIGLKSIPAYMRKMRSLLGDDGLFLNHAIARRARKPSWLPGALGQRRRPELKAIQKYIFPGGELDDIGHSVWAMERAGFEVHDVEAWRLHYARTCTLWHDRLVANRDEAIRLVGEPKYRIWVAYLAGCALAFSRGTLRIFQTLASKSPKRPPALPPTRADLYR